MKINFKIVFGFVIIAFLNACNGNQQKPIDVDLSRDSMSADSTSNSSRNTLKVAVSTMISPKETFIYYKDLFEYISEKLNKRVVFKQKKTYDEVNQMLINSEVDIAFICSGAYVQKSDKMNLMVAPVCNGLVYYQAYLIVNKNSGINNFTELKGKKFAYTDPLSNTGKFYAEKKIKELNQESEIFFSKIVFTHAHDISIQLVEKGVVDGATIDGLIFEYLAKFYPEKVKNIKIIEKSEQYGIPPIVTSLGVSDTLKEELQKILLNLHETSEGKRILENLLVDKFTLVNDSIYDNVRKVKDFICK